MVLIQTVCVNLRVRYTHPDICQPRHQIGGIPYLVQQEFDEMVCPICGRRMPFLAAIADEAPEGHSFTVNDHVQVLYYFCIDCYVISAIQRCD